MTPGLDLSSANTMLRELLQKSAVVLSTETTDAVLHYLDHDEYEMAFEGLFIDLIEVDFFPSNLPWLPYRQLGEALGMDQHQNFRSDFWDTFQRFGDGRPCQDSQ